jgi:hypothetical protein
MPITEGIIIPITADASGLQDGIDQAKQAVSDFSGATSSAISDSAGQWDILQDKLQRYTSLAEQASNLGLDDSFKRAARGIAQTEAQLDAYTNSLKNADQAAIALRAEQQKAVEVTKQIVNATNTATVSQEANRNVMMAMNRVIKDSHSLLYSSTRGVAELSYALPYLFQRMGEVKEETGSWKGALSSLGGSLFSMTGLMFAAGTAIAFYLRSHKTAKEAVNEHDEAIKKFNEEVDKATGKAQQQGFELKAYISIASDHTKSLLERNRALAEANKLYGDHNEKLTLTSIETKKVTDLVQGYTQALIDSAIAAKYGDKLADGYFKQREAARAYGVEQDKLYKQKQLLDKAALKSNEDPMKGVRSGVGDLTLLNAQTAYAAQLKKTTDAADVYKLATKDLTGTTSDYISVLTKANEEEAKFGANLKTRPDKKEKTKRPEKYFEAYHPKAPLYSTLGDAKNGVRAKELQVLIRGIGKTAGDTAAQIKKASVDEQAEINKTNLATEQWQNTLLQIRNVVVNDLNQAFTKTFENIGQGGKSAIQSIMSDIGNLIKKLISAAMAAAALAAIMSATGLGISGAGGVMQNGFGDIFKTLFGSTSGIKMASGGITNGPTRALIGEGKEREVVTPLSQLKNIIGNVGGSRAMPVPQLYMRGADMWIMWQRQQQQNLRNF